MHELFPADANPFLEEYFIEVGEPLTKGPMSGQKHRVRVGCFGNPDGRPVVVVHGGPGGGCADDYARVFPPNAFYILMIDQRGAGRSMPSAYDCLSTTGELEGNNTDALIEDMEVVRKKLIGPEKNWIVFGGSWGATLGLLYAQRYSEHVDALVLRGVWLAKPKDWCRIFEDVTENFLKSIRPDAWESFSAPFKKIQKMDDTDDMPRIRSCFSLIADLNADDTLKREMMLAWAAWESWLASSSTAVGKPLHDAVIAYNPHDDADEIQHIFSFCTVQVFYYMHNCFVEPNQILNNVSTLKNIKDIYIVQGSNDFVCTEGTGAYPLKQALEAIGVPIHYDLCDQTGHSFGEAGIVDGLIRAMMALLDSVKVYVYKNYLDILEEGTEPLYRSRYVL